MDDRAGDERRLRVAELEDERRVEPAGQLLLGVALVAVDAEERPAEVLDERRGEDGLADADRPLEQEVPTRLQAGQRQLDLHLATDDAVGVLDVLDLCDHQLDRRVDGDFAADRGGARDAVHDDVGQPHFLHVDR